MRCDLRTRCGSAIVGIAVVALASTPANAEMALERDASGTLSLSNVRRGAERDLVAPTLPRATRIPPSAYYRQSRYRPATRWAAFSPKPTQFDDLIREISGRHGVDFALVKAVIRAESNFNPAAVSPKGARGLMQLMPQTARRHSVRNMLSPRDNIEGGVRHLRMLLDRYSGNERLALAAYNAGEHAVERHGMRIPPYRETLDYVPRVLNYRLGYHREDRAREPLAAGLPQTPRTQPQ